MTVKEFAWAHSNRPTDIILRILEVDLDTLVLRGIVDNLEFEVDAVKRAWNCDPEYFLSIPLVGILRCHLVWRRTYVAS